MDFQQFDEGYRRLKGYFSAKDNQEKYDLWRKKLRSYPGTAYELAVDNIIEGERFFPTLSVMKTTIYSCMTPQEKGLEGDLSDVGEKDMALGRELFPLWRRFLSGFTTKQEWISQMRFFANKHGLGEDMERSIKESGIEKEVQYERGAGERIESGLDRSDGPVGRERDVKEPHDVPDRKDSEVPAVRTLPRSVESRLRRSYHADEDGSRGGAEHSKGDAQPRAETPVPKREGGW